MNLWPNLTGGEAIDLLGRLRGGLDRAPACGAARAVRPRPDEEGAAPTRRATGRRSPWSPRSRRMSSCCARRADLGARPADGVGVPGLRRGVSRRRAGPSCCRATSSPRSRRCATGSASSAGAAPWRPARSPNCVTSRARRSRPNAAPGRPALRGRRGRARRCAVDGPHTRFEVDTARLDGVLRHLLSFGVTSLTSTPPTLEELFLRHYGDELAREGENHRRAESGTRPR